jgi:hypothetical protein
MTPDHPAVSASAAADSSVDAQAALAQNIIPAASISPELTTSGREEKLQDYQTAVGLFQYEGQLRWTIFGIFLLVETVLLSVLADKALQPAEHKSWLLIAGGVTGLFLVHVWYRTFKHYTGFYALRIHQAKALEKDLGFHSFTEGAQFAEGNPPARHTDFPSKHRLSGADLKYGGVTTARSIVLVFASLFAALVVIGIATF